LSIFSREDRHQGLFPAVDARLDLDLETLRPGMLVADIIPNPLKTQLIREAEKRGCKVLDELGMVVNQGVIGVKYWTGIHVDAAVMRRTILDLFEPS
jgi:shikimate dehydrogenase